MRVVRANILSVEVLTQADAVCFTSNGIVKRDGTAVMGAGVARAFKQKFPQLPQQLAQRLNSWGNRVHVLDNYDVTSTLIISFPTKNHWRNPSTLELISKSAAELRKLADIIPLNNIWLPKPGCANGGLSWDVVRPVLEPHFDDRFTICYL